MEIALPRGKPRLEPGGQAYGSRKKPFPKGLLSALQTLGFSRLLRLPDGCQNHGGIHGVLALSRGLRRFCSPRVHAKHLGAKIQNNGPGKFVPINTASPSFIEMPELQSDMARRRFGISDNSRICNKKMDGGDCVNSDAPLSNFAGLGR